MTDAIPRGKIEAVQKAVGFVHLHVHTSFSLREGALLRGGARIRRAHADQDGRARALSQRLDDRAQREA